jgi:hypothetical protein
VSTNDNVTDKLKAEAEKAAAKAHEDGDAARAKLEGAEAKVKAEVHKQTTS